MLLVAGCGCGDETDTTTSAAPATAGGPTGDAEEGEAKRRHGENGQRGGGKGAGHKGSKRKETPPQGIAPADPKSLPNEGSKAVAPGVPVVRNGDNSIQTYGVEATSDERVQAATTVKAYLDAQVAGRWSEACSLLVAETREKMETLAKKAPRTKIRGCEGLMEAIVGGLPKNLLRNVADLHVLSMRREADRGFLIYEDGHGAPTEIPLQREGQEWKVRALIPKDLIAR